MKLKKSNLNRIWRRKFLLVLTVVLIFLIITITLTNSGLSAFSSLFGQRKPRTFPTHVQPFQKDLWESIPHDDMRPLLNQKQTVFMDSGIGIKKFNGYIPKKRYVHLDLKGAPPKVTYFEKLFPLIRKAGANGLLLEYEDSFPYEGKLKYVVNDYAYTKEDIQKIKLLAKSNDLEIIPLVQTLGHLEFVLKLQQYRSLRENDIFPQAICPLNPDTFPLLTEMIDQILAMHPNAKRLHIGCDEVYQIGECNRCRNNYREDLFLSHVKNISSYLKTKYNVIPIIWDDMLRTFSSEVIKSYALHKLDLEIMIWTYISDIYRFIPQTTWTMYSETFPKIWGASAFKGAFGETLTMPNVQSHLENNIAWLNVFEEQASSFRSIEGLVVTGWQRYDHLATLCELLPSGLPSLMLDLLTISHGRFDTKLFEQYHKLMSCGSIIESEYHTKNKIFSHDPLFSYMSNCRFPGSKVFRLMVDFERIGKQVDSYLYDVTVHKAWLTEYNFRHNITNPSRIQEGLQSYYDVMDNLKSLARSAVSVLGEVFHESTVFEWIEQKIYPFLVDMEKFYNESMRLKELRVWPRRPIKPAEDLFRFLNNNE